MRTIGEDFSQDIKVNRFKLDEENEISGELYNVWSERYSEARGYVDIAKDKLELTTAQRTLFYSNNPIDGIKPTVDNVKAMVEQDTEVQTAKDAYRQALAKRYTLDGGMGALESRNKGVDNLTKLQISGYYNAGRTGGDTAADEINDSLNRRDS
jgi:hypothetical protein